jgi:hypothetical protein
MLTCIAIILNMGPFAGAPGNAPTTAGTSVGKPLATEQRVARSLARWDTDLQVDRPRSLEPEFAERVAALTQPSPFIFASAAPAPAPPAWAEDAGEADRAPPAAESQPEQAGDAARDAIVGVWAPGTCSARDFRDGLLPTITNTEGAWAGETFCLFTKRRQTESGWAVVAKCSNARERWTSNVRLTVSENRLTWTSRRGTQAYARCAPDVLMAQANSRP